MEIKQRPSRYTVKVLYENRETSANYRVPDIFKAYEMAYKLFDVNHARNVKILLSDNDIVMHDFYSLDELKTFWQNKYPEWKLGYTL